MALIYYQGLKVGILRRDFRSNLSNYCGYGILAVFQTTTPTLPTSTYLYV